MNFSEKITTTREIKKKHKKKKIVLANGVFDIFHIGHLWYLEAAKKLGDILVVSITSDRCVNKGPLRPFFTQNQRIQLLSSIELVDYIVINDNVSSIKLIKDLEPDIYVKGKDYKNPKLDITRNITKEKKAVETCGGKLIIIDQMQFSSSKIINSFFRPNKIINNFKNLESVRKKSLDSINKLSDLKILVLGEIIFDKYIFVKELDKPGKENIKSVKYKNDSTYLGGAFPIAKILSSFVKKVDILCVGNFNSIQNNLIKKLSKDVSNLKSKIYNSPFNSITKTRYIDEKNVKLFEEYNLNGEKKFENYNLRKIFGDINNYDLVILADFGHGLFDKNIINFISKHSKFLSVNAQTNSGNRGFNLITKYKKANYICLDKLEINLAMSNRDDNIDYQIKELYKKIKTGNITVSLGAQGIIVSKKIRNKINYSKLPAFEVKPVDTLGAGDAVFAISSALIKKNTNIEITALISNLVGALQTNILGHSKSITKIDVIKALTHALK